MIDTKLTFTLYDIIGHIIPGMFVLILTAWAFELGVSADPATVTGTFIVIGYIVGHLLHAVGSWLLQTVWWMPKSISRFMDKVFGLVRTALLIRVRKTPTEIKDQIKSELVRVKLVAKSNHLDELELYDFCNNILLESGSVDGRDILEAKEAFYRSLIPTIIYSAIILSYSPPLPFFENWFLVVVVTVLLVEFLYFRREYYRRIKNNQIYKQALIKLKKM